MFDLIIVGGGPAGATAALYARRQGLKTLLVDKATFPRDKVCGDALSGKAVVILKDLDLLEQTAQLPGAVIQRIIFSSPNHTVLEIDLTASHLNQIPEGYVIRRKIFDQFMFDQAKQSVDTCLEDFTVTDVILEEGVVCGIRGRQAGSADELAYRGRIVLGADGYNSIIARKTGLYRFKPKHTVVALRQYYKNVGGLTNQIELHFIDEVIPGYFWLFPLENGYANVGIGMLHTHIKRREISLKDALQAAINSPTFRDRFADATPEEEPVGWNLPVGSVHNQIVGAGFMLLGDAAGLIDPFTGEGIGNALYSARYAVETAREAVDTGDVSAAFLARYDKHLWDYIGDELKVSTRLQKIGQVRFLLNLVIGKAARNRDIADIIAGMIANEVPKDKLANPLFYLKALFS